MRWARWAHRGGESGRGLISKIAELDDEEGTTMTATNEEIDRQAKAIHDAGARVPPVAG